MFCVCQDAGSAGPERPRRRRNEKQAEKPTSDMIGLEAFKSVCEGGGWRREEAEKKRPLKRDRFPCGRSAERGWSDV